LIVTRPRHSPCSASPSPSKGAPRARKAGASPPGKASQAGYFHLLFRHFHSCKEVQLASYNACQIGSAAPLRPYAELGWRHGPARRLCVADFVFCEESSGRYPYAFTSSSISSIRSKVQLKEVEASATR
jgi:hypothetical protein